MAFGVLLFPFLIASKLHSTISIVGLLLSQFVMFTPAIMQSGDLAAVDQQWTAIEKSTSIDTVEGVSISQVRVGRIGEQTT